MSNVARIIIAVIIVALLGGGILWYLSSRSTPTTTTDTPWTTSLPDENTPANTDSDVAASTTITYDGEQFSPAAITVPVGSTITVINNSSDEIDFASDPHPTHTANTELNTGMVAPGERRSFTVNQKGTWGYHDHLNASRQGTITVE